VLPELGRNRETEPAIGLASPMFQPMVRLYYLYIWPPAIMAYDTRLNSLVNLTGTSQPDTLYTHHNRLSGHVAAPRTLLPDVSASVDTELLRLGINTQPDVCPGALHQPSRYDDAIETDSDHEMGYCLFPVRISQGKVLRPLRKPRFKVRQVCQTNTDIFVLRSSPGLPLSPLMHLPLYH
jgi:hypothetical protein